tara:strand:- start:65 stop:1006 length:942 start_codon:yes stop_codon:yes gene_type:complete
MPEGFKLVGDYHVTRGGITIIGGPPGLGKSRAALQLARAGATQSAWFGHQVHSSFKTLLLQNENGRHRLKNDFEQFPFEFEEHVLITPPPEYGMRFDHEGFRYDLRKKLMEFRPGVIVIDPFTNIVSDSTLGDYSEAFDAIRDCLPPGDNIPATVIVAHTRKPKSTERPQGTDLLYELLGSTKLGSMARVAYVMQSASNDTEDDRVVWTCCKNNDGEKGPRSSWVRKDSFFSPCTDFDWDEFENPSKGNERVTFDHVKSLFNNRMCAARSVLVEELIESTGCGKAAAYNALKLDGRFGKYLREDPDGLISWIK